MENFNEKDIKRAGRGGRGPRQALAGRFTRVSAFQARGRACQAFNPNASGIYWGARGALGVGQGWGGCWQDERRIHMEEEPGREGSEVFEN